MERDARIMEVERLLDCMGKVKEVHVRLEGVCAGGKVNICQLIHLGVGFLNQEKGQLQMKLQESEQRLRLLELTDTTDGPAAKR